MADDSANTSSGVISSVFGFVTREIGAFVTSATGGVVSHPVHNKKDHRNRHTGHDAPRKEKRLKTHRTAFQSAQAKRSSPSAYGYEGKRKNQGREHRVDPDDSENNRAKRRLIAAKSSIHPPSQVVSLDQSAETKDQKAESSDKGDASTAMPPPSLPFASPVFKKPSMPGSLFARSPTPAEFRRRSSSLHTTLAEVERPKTPRRSECDEIPISNIGSRIIPRDPTPPRPSPRRLPHSPTRHVRFNPNVMARKVTPIQVEDIPQSQEEPEKKPEKVVLNGPEVKVENDDDIILLSEPPPCFSPRKSTPKSRKAGIAERQKEAEAEADTLRTKGSQGDADRERIHQLEEEIKRLKAELAQRPPPSTDTSFVVPPPPPPPPPPPVGKANGRIATSRDTTDSPRISTRPGLQSTPPLRRTVNKSLLPTVPAASMEKFLSELKTVKLRSVAKEDTSFRSSVGSSSQSSICVGLQNLKAGLKRKRDLGDEDYSSGDSSTVHKRRIDDEPSFADVAEVGDMSSTSLFFNSARPNTSSSYNGSRSMHSSLSNKAQLEPPRVNTGFISGSGRRIPPSAIEIPLSHRQTTGLTRLGSSKHPGFTPSEMTTPSLCSDTEVDQDQDQDQDVQEDRVTTPPILLGLDINGPPQRMSAKALGKMKEVADNTSKPLPELHEDHHRSEQPQLPDSSYISQFGVDVGDEEEDVDFSIPPLRRPPHRPKRLTRSTITNQESADRSVVQARTSPEQTLAQQQPNSNPDSSISSKPPSKQKPSLPVHGSPSIFSVRLPTSPLPTDKGFSRKPKPPGRRIPTPGKVKPSFTNNPSLQIHSAAVLQLVESDETPGRNNRVSTSFTSVTDRGSPLPYAKTDKRTSDHGVDADVSLTLDEEIRRASRGAPSLARIELEKELAEEEAESGVFTGFGTRDKSDVGYLSGGGGGGVPVLGDISTTSTSSDSIPGSKKATSRSKIPVPVSRSRTVSHSQALPPVLS